MILQPKRWQLADSPIYDPIRFRPWFQRLLKRKKHITKMRACLFEFAGAETALTQEEHCDKWNVSPREFRDFVNFWSGEGPPISPEYLSILTSAYNAYCEHSAIRPIQRFIADIAPLYGVNYRHVWEMWEIHPKFYPSDYVYYDLQRKTI